MPKSSTARGSHEQRDTICLWYNGEPEAAAASTRRRSDSAVGAVQRAPGDYPDGKQGDALVVHFTVCGIACIGLNGGPAFPQTEAFSFQIATEDQAETDRYWNAIVANGGAESSTAGAGSWGLNWQITPRTLTEAMAAGGRKPSALDAMMTMRKIDVARIDAARRG